MAGPIATLRVMLAGDDAQLRTALGRSDKASKKWAKAQERRNKMARESFKRVALGVAAVGTAFATASSEAIKYADQLAKQARTLGITVEQLQEYTFAAERSGVSTAEMVKGLQQFNKFVGQAARGTGTAKKAFDDMGISILNMDGSIRGQEELINDFVDKISTIESPMMRAGLASDVFGRAGVKLLPMMSQGSAGLAALRKAAHEMGNVMENETAAKAEILNDKLDTFTTALKTKFYSALVEGTDQHLPAIVKAMDYVQASFEILSGSIDGLLSTWHLFRAGIYTTTAAMVGFGQSIGEGIAAGVMLLPAYFNLAQGYIRKGFAQMVHAAAQAGDAALSKAPDFVKKFFGYEDGALSSGTGKLVDQATAQITGAISRIDTLKQQYADSGKPSLLETSLLGTADEAINQAVLKAQEGRDKIFGAIANTAQGGGIASGVDTGVGALATDDVTTNEKADPTAELTSHWDKFQKGMKDRQQILSSSFGKTWKDIGASYIGNLSKMGKAGKAFAIAQTVYTTGQAVMAAMSDKSVPSFFMRLANAGVATMMGAQQISSIKGQAHDGMDNIPSTGTYMLEKGERVVGKRLNGDLKESLKSGGVGSSGPQNITFSVQGVEDPDVINRVINENRGEFESMLRQINTDRAGAGLI